MDGVDWLNNRPSWDDYFISLAILASTKSHDIQTKCGAVLVDQDNTIIATGCNGFTPKAPDQFLPNTRPDKYPWMLHAEKNILLSCNRQGKSTVGGTLYVFGEPCWACFYDIISAGISKLKYIDHPSIKMNTFSSTTEWKTQRYWIKEKIIITKLDISNLKLSKNILKSVFPQVYNTKAGT